MWIMLLAAVILAQIAYVYHHSNQQEDNTESCDGKRYEYPSANELEALINRYSLSESLTTFQQLRPGDIVVCVMPLKANQLHGISPNHRVRPYIVVDKKEDSILAFAGSSKGNHSGKKGMFRLEKGKYRVWKNGWIDTKKIWSIPNTHIMEKLDTLSRKDAIEINKALEESNRKKHIPVSANQSSLFPGAVLEKEGKYYYCWNVSPVYRLLPMEHLGTFAIRFDHDPYYLDPYTVIGEETLDDYTYVGTARSNVLKELNSKFMVTDHSGQITVRRRTKADKQTREEKFMFLYPPGKVLALGANRVMYLYSRNDKAGYMKHFGITEEEAQSCEPIVNEIVNFSFYKPEDQIEGHELMEILADAAVRKGKHFLLKVPMEYHNRIHHQHLLN